MCLIGANQLWDQVEQKLLSTIYFFLSRCLHWGLISNSLTAFHAFNQAFFILRCIQLFKLFPRKWFVLMHPLVRNGCEKTWVEVMGAFFLTRNSTSLWSIYALSGLPFLCWDQHRNCTSSWKTQGPRTIGEDAVADDDLCCILKNKLYKCPSHGRDEQSGCYLGGRCFPHWYSMMATKILAEVALRRLSEASIILYNLVFGYS